MRSNLKHVLACAIALAVTALAVGCGSSDDGDSGADTSAKQTTPAAKLTGEPIKVAHVSDIEAEGVEQPDAVGGVKVGIEAFNAAGGIDGRPIELVAVCNTERNPNTARACVRKAVADGVVAFIGNVTSADDGIIPVLDEAKVPAIGSVPLSPVTGGSSTAFCFNGGLAAAVIGLPGALKTDGATKISLLYPSNIGSASAGIKEAFELGAESTGLENAGSVGFNLGETQFDAPVAKASANGVNGIALLAPGEPEAALIRAVRQSRPEMKLATVNSLLTPSVLDALGSSANGVSAVGIAQPATAENVPGIAKFNKDMATFDPDEEYARNDLAVNSWASIWALVQIAGKLPEIDRASLLKAMEETEGLDLGGIYPPLSAASRKTNPPEVGCAMAIGNVYVEVKDGKTFAVEPGKFDQPFAD